MVDEFHQRRIILKKLNLILGETFLD